MGICDFVPEEYYFSDNSEDEEIFFEPLEFVPMPVDDTDDNAYDAWSEASSDDFPDIVVEYDDDDVPLDQLFAMDAEEFYPFEDAGVIHLNNDVLDVDHMLAELPDLGGLEERLNFWRERGAFDRLDEPDDIVREALVLSGLGELADLPDPASDDDQS